ncbi:MAG TPA: efflux RND transporter permease subunit [Bryobacteraceae bacterium]|nr:efflux RND transporter permease subunit [Bryobacteraceae bacterium]
MWIVRLALRRPYTFVVVAVLIAILGGAAIITMPVDIFPYIDIPVVSIVWSYSGLPPEEMEKRMVTVFERAMTTTVNDIEHIESQSYSGVSVTRVYFQPNAKIDLALSQVTAISQTLLRIFPPGTTPPIILKYDASSVPILQLGLGSKTLAEQELYDLGQNFIRTQLATIQGAAVPSPFGGKNRAVMVDINPELLFSRGLTPIDVSNALGNQNLILPAGDVKIGVKDYQVKVNSSPRALADLNNMPLKIVNGATVYLGDVAQVHDGYTVQTGLVRINGTRGALLTVLRNGQASTLAVVNNVKKALPKILAGVTTALQVRQFFDQSLFVRAAINGVVREAVTAAVLTGLMILMFLGSWRSTVIVCISIPLSILVSLIVLNLTGQTINVMTLGGMALAVGILVDDATVEIENTHRNMAMKKPLVRAVLDGAQQIAAPAFVSTLCICIVFVPVLLLTGAAKYLFTPLAMAVVFAMMASYLLSRTLIPTMVHYLLKVEVQLYAHGEHGETAGGKGIIWKLHYMFNRRFELMRASYTSLLHWALDHRVPVLAGFGLFIGASLLLATFIGRDFFPVVDSGQMRLHARAPSGTRVEETESLFAGIEREIRQTIPPAEMENIIDNIGLPSSGFNLGFGDSPTIGVSDGDILISLNPEKHGPTAEYTGRLRKRLHQKFPDVVFFFEAANITNQILNFGLPAPIDVQVVGRNTTANYQIADKLRSGILAIPGAVDVHIHQVVDYPELHVDVDRSKAAMVGLTQKDAANSMLISLTGSAQVAPTQWLDYNTGVSYFVTVQTPQYKVNSIERLMSTPISPGSPFSSSTPTSLAGVANAGDASVGSSPSQASQAYGNPGAAAANPQLLANMAKLSRSVGPEIISHYNVQPVFDVYANVDRRDLGSVGSAVEKLVAEAEKSLPRGSSIVVRGQISTMQTSFFRLGLGMILAVVLVYLLMAVNFQSWLDPFIILMALPGALAGIVWILFLTQTTFSVPSLMGSIMCIGVATANSILMVVFANDQREEGMDSRSAALAAGHTRIRPVIMTASAMIIGMLPMALGMGEGGEQNAPLGRAVIGGLILATVTTLFVVPLVYSMLRTKPPVDHERRIVDEEHEYLRDEMLLGEDVP